MSPRALVPIVPLVLVVLAACSTRPGDYPSLAIRDAERVSGTLQPPPPYVPPPTPAPVLDRVAQLRAEAESAHSGFLSETPGARRTILAASGATVGSESWAQAQVALAGLQAARGKAMVALADLDRLYVDAAVEALELERIAAARTDVIAMVEAEDATIAELAGVLR